MSFSPVSFDELADFIASKTRIPRSDIRPNTTLNDGLKLNKETGEKLLNALFEKYKTGSYFTSIILYLPSKDGDSDADCKSLNQFGYINRPSGQWHIPAPTVDRLLEDINCELRFNYCLEHGLPLPPPPPFILPTLQQHRTPLYHITVMLLNIPIWAFAVWMIAIGAIGIFVGIMTLIISLVLVWHKWVFFAPRFFTNKHITQIDASDEGCVFHYAVGLNRQSQKTPLIPYGQMKPNERGFYFPMDIKDVGQLHFYINLFRESDFGLFYTPAFMHRILKPSKSQDPPPAASK